MYKISYAKSFKKDFKRLDCTDQEHVLEILQRLSNNEILEPKYKDHALSGELAKYRDCHIKPDLVLIYEKKKDVLILIAMRIDSHSNIFKK